nr:hypothetical protein [uncultured Shinella sp.]
MKRATTGGRYVRDTETGVVKRAEIDEAKAKPAPPAEEPVPEPQTKTPSGGKGK